MGRRVLGSALATLFGWIVGWVALIVFYWVANGYFGHLSWYLVRDSLGILLMMGVFIVPVWGAMVLPIYLLGPRSGFLWSPFVCVPFGAIVGFLIMQGMWAYIDIVTYHSGRHAFDLCPFAVFGAIVGATTGLAAKLTYHWFNPATR